MNKATVSGSCVLVLMQVRMGRVSVLRLTALLPDGKEPNLNSPSSTSVLELKFLIAHQITRQDLYTLSKS